MTVSKQTEAQKRAVDFELLSYGRIEEIEDNNEHDKTIILLLCANLRHARSEIDASREKVASFMLLHGYPTGHGDTIDDLLLELDAYIPLA